LPVLDAPSLQAIKSHQPTNLDDYRLARVAEWSQPRYALDRRFTRLTLLLDQGPDAREGRWRAQPKRYDDLRTVLTDTGEPALVLLGPPGCGKSTLLRRLELDLGLDALRQPGAGANAVELSHSCEQVVGRQPFAAADCSRICRHGDADLPPHRNPPCRIVCYTSQRLSNKVPMPWSVSNSNKTA
jgi:hypothetical protein